MIRFHDTAEKKDDSELLSPYLTERFSSANIIAEMI